MDVYIIQKQMRLACSNFMKLRRKAEHTTPRTGGCLPPPEITAPRGGSQSPLGGRFFRRLAITSGGTHPISCLAKKLNYTRTLYEKNIPYSLLLEAVLFPAYIWIVGPDRSRSSCHFSFVHPSPRLHFESYRYLFPDRRYSLARVSNFDWQLLHVLLCRTPTSYSA